jgi:hypothetical protein
MADELTIKNKEVLELFKQNSKVGTEEMGEIGTMPILKLVHSQTKAEACTLANGQRATNGKLFHPITLKEYSKVSVYPLYLKKAELPSYTDKKVLKLNYIMAGLLEEDNVPFIAFIKGMSLNPFWDWQKELNRFITNPLQPVPMLALKTNLEVSERDSGKFGMQKFIKLSFVRSESGLVEIEQNPEKLNKLVAMIPKAKELVEFALSDTNGEAVDDEFIDQQNGERSTYTKKAEEILND